MRRSFESMSMKESNSVDSFYTRVVGLINQLKYHGETIADQRVIEKFLRSLLPRFESLVVTFEENKDMLAFTIDELQASLINHETHISLNLEIFYYKDFIHIEFFCKSLNTYSIKSRKINSNN